MLGTSYSGFTTVQVAAMAPPALKAIAPAYFTDRRYTDDCHYKGGCLRGFYDVLSCECPSPAAPSCALLHRADSAPLQMGSAWWR